MVDIYPLRTQKVREDDHELKASPVYIVRSCLWCGCGWVVESLQHHIQWAWSCMCVIPAPSRWRQEDEIFKVLFYSTRCSKPFWLNHCNFSLSLHPSMISSKANTDLKSMKGMEQKDLQTWSKQGTVFSSLWMCWWAAEAHGSLIFEKNQRYSEGSLSMLYQGHTGYKTVTCTSISLHEAFAISYWSFSGELRVQCREGREERCGWWEKWWEK